MEKRLLETWKSPPRSGRSATAKGRPTIRQNAEHQPLIGTTMKHQISSTSRATIAKDRLRLQFSTTLQLVELQTKTTPANQPCTKEHYVTSHYGPQQNTKYKAEAKWEMTEGVPVISHNMQDHKPLMTQQQKAA